MDATHKSTEFHQKWKTFPLLRARTSQADPRLRQGLRVDSKRKNPRRREFLKPHCTGTLLGSYFAKGAREAASASTLPAGVGRPSRVPRHYFLLDLCFSAEKDLAVSQVFLTDEKNLFFCFRGTESGRLEGIYFRLGPSRPKKSRTLSNGRRGAASGCPQPNQGSRTTCCVRTLSGAWCNIVVMLSMCACVCERIPPSLPLSFFRFSE